MWFYREQATRKCPWGKAEPQGRRGPRGAILLPVASRHSAAIEGWLLADVGGTRARLAFLAAGGTLGPIRVADNDRYPDLRALIASGLETFPKDRSRLGAALAVAALVVGDAVAMTNRDWDFSIAGLRRELGVAHLHVLNDFTAIAWSIPALAAEDTLPIGGGMARAGAPIGVLGPGSGCRGVGAHPLRSGARRPRRRGGHVTLAPASEAEEAVLAMVRRRFGHASAERLVSGPGLVTLVCWTGGMRGRPVMHRPPVYDFYSYSKQKPALSLADCPTPWLSMIARSVAPTRIT